MGEREAINRLLARWPENKINPSLVRIEQLLSALGNPEKSFKSLHIAGTNGKTSTARMVTNLLLELNLRVGLYTSPHLIHPRERIVIDGDSISESEFERALDDIEPILKLVEANFAGENLTFFEVVTALAYQYFSEVPIDLAVVEVGLGGTWDATNVITPEVSLITPISFDHMDYLGDTLDKIASEKAGILKAGSTAVITQQAPAAEKILRAKCSELMIDSKWQGIDFQVANRKLALGGQVFDVITPYTTHTAIFSKLYGEFQAQNAAAAITAVEVLLDQPLASEIVVSAFEKTTSPGRIEVIKRNPTIIIDAAHNPSGVAVSRRAIEESFKFTETILLLGCMKDKDIPEMLKELSGFAQTIITTQVQSDRAMDHKELARMCMDYIPDSTLVASDFLPNALLKAIEYAKEKEGSGIVVLGSIALVGAVKSLL